MIDLLGHPIHPGPFTTQTTDGFTGTVHEFGEDRYLEPEQRETGWPALHLYSFRNANTWDRAKARAWVIEWLRWSLPPSCDCAVHWQATVETFPMTDAVFASPDSFFDWSVNCHNHVNSRLDVDESHPQVPLARAREIWSRIAAAGQVAWFRPVNDTISGGRRLVITVATGKAREWLRYTEGPMRGYAADCDADFVILQNTTQGWWGLEKFRVHEFAKAYHQTLYLDADVLVTRLAKDLFSGYEPQELCSTDGIDNYVAIYNELDDLQSSTWVAGCWDKVDQCIGPTLKNKHWGQSYNSGVVFCDKRGSSVWTPPKLPIPTFHVAEQIVVGMNLMRHRPLLHPLRVSRNLQVWNPHFKLRLPSAEFVHLSGLDKKTEEIKKMIELLKSVGNPVYQGCK